MISQQQTNGIQMKTAIKETLVITLVVVCLAAITACGGGGGSSSRPSSSPAPVTTQSQLQGVWEKRGYGLVLDISGNRVAAYDFTTQTCARQPVDDLSSLTSELDTITADGDEFTLRAALTGFVDRYFKVASLPTVCATPIGASATEMFEHTWHTFNEYYAFFVERNVDWGNEV